MNDASRLLESLVADVNAKKRDVHKAAKDLDKLREKLAQHQRAVESEASRVAELVDKADSVSRRLVGDDYAGRPTDLVVNNKRYKTVDQIKARITVLQTSKQKALEMRNVAEIDLDLARNKMEKAAATYDEKMSGCKRIEEEGTALQTDARARFHRLLLIRRHICRRSGNTFNDILNNKGASGQLYFDHKEKTLTLSYQKDSADESTQIENVTSLSGGERSFSTLAMLLAMGKTIECPFRVMDEFDVFMDQVSRKIAMRELVEMANQHQDRQFIFITPQDLSSLQMSNILKIFKLYPPIRGQQTIVDAFAAAPAS